MADTTGETPKCFACLDVAPANYYVFGGRRWKAENVLPKIATVCGKNIKAAVRNANVGICRPCLTMLVKTYAFVEGMLRNIATLSDRSTIKRPPDSPEAPRPVKKPKQQVAKPVFEVCIFHELTMIQIFVFLYYNTLQYVLNIYTLYSFRFLYVPQSCPFPQV